jgi:hypothetical protein
MLCCTNCFKDNFLRITIDKIGEKNNCFFCGAQNNKCIDTDKLPTYLQPLFDLYVLASEVSHDVQSTSYESKYIWEQLNHDFQFFSDDCNSEKLTKQIIKDTYADDEDGLKKISEKVILFGGTIDRVYQDRIKLWEEQMTEMKTKNRFFYSNKIPQKILGETLQRLVYKVEEGTSYFRSRLSINREPVNPEEMGTPPPESAVNGRANPAGISYLYLSSNYKTAIYEVKPAIKDFICVGEFLIKKDLQCIDFREISPIQFYDTEEYERDFKYLGLLKLIGQNLSESINHRMAHLEYIPAQFICEFIKKEYDGVLYNSSSDLGYNLAIFKKNCAECKKVNCYEIEQVQYDEKNIAD